MNRLVRLLAILAFTGLAAGELRTLRDIAYKDDVVSQTPYEQERCKLDLTLPADAKGFPTYVWFYGGG